MQLTQELYPRLVEEDLVVRFVPVADSGKRRAWEGGERVEVEVVDRRKPLSEEQVHDEAKCKESGRMGC